MRHEYKRRGHRWRVQDDGARGDFDEIVVVHGRETRAGKDWSGLVLHAEAMGSRSWFVDVAGFCLWVHTGRDGIARITMSEDRRPGSKGTVDLRDPALGA